MVLPEGPVRRHRYQPPPTVHSYLNKMNEAVSYMLSRARFERKGPLALRDDLVRVVLNSAQIAPPPKLSSAGVKGCTLLKLISSGGYL